MQFGTSKRNDTKRIVRVLAVSTTLIAILYLLEDSIRKLLSSYLYETVAFQISILGDAIPSKIYEHLFWNPKLRRAVNYKGNRIKSYRSYISDQIIIFVIWFVFSQIFIVPIVCSLYAKIIVSSFPFLILFLLFLIVSTLLLAVVIISITSPIGLKRAIKSFSKVLLAKT